MDGLKPKLILIESSQEYLEDLRYKMSEVCNVVHINTGDNIAVMIESFNPDIVYFNLDYPYPELLAIISQTKQDYPSIPIIILTEFHSEELAVWALRARVWEYLVKPLSYEELIRPVLLLQRVQNHGRCLESEPIAQSNDVLGSSQMKPSRIAQSINKAKNYIEANIDQKLSESVIASEFGFSPQYFSRSFKEICGISFREYVINLRIKKAKELLLVSESPVTSICYEVGFRDSSNFSNAFRRFAGMSPREYRLKSRLKTLYAPALKNNFSKDKFKYKTIQH